MPDVPDRLGRYRLLDRLGAGGMGEVWRAHDDNLDRDVAIKVLAAHALDDADTRERFRREAHMLSRLSHPGVATIFDFDTVSGTDFLVMELVPGGSLETRIGQGLLSIDEVVRFGAANSIRALMARIPISREPMGCLGGSTRSRRGGFWLS